MITDTTNLAEALVLSKEVFRQKHPEKHPMMPTEFNSRIKDAEAAIVALDTDAYDMRQRMEPFFNNPHLNKWQQERVKVLGQNLMKVLIEHGLVDAWGVAVHETKPNKDNTQT